MKRDDESPHPIPPSDFRLLFEAVPDPCLVLDPDLRIVGVNNAYLQATMTKPEEILGKGLFELFPDNPADPGATGPRNVMASLRRVLSSGVADVMGVHKFSIRRPGEEGGSIDARYWSAVNVPVFGLAGGIAYIIHRVQDVTGYLDYKSKAGEEHEMTPELQWIMVQKEAEIYNKSLQLAEASYQLKRSGDDLLAQRKELQELNERLKEEITERMLLSSIVASSNWPIISLALGREGVIKTWNSGAERVYGYRSAEVIGKKITLLVPPEEVAEISSLLEKIGGGDEIVDYEAVRLKKDRTPIHILLHIFPVRDARGKIIGVSESGIDITERKREEREREHLLGELEAILESINEGVAVCDQEGTLLRMNRLGLSLHGYSSEDMRRKLSEYQDSIELFRLEGGILPFEEWPMSRAMRGERFSDYLVRVRRKGVGNLWVGSYSGTPVNDKSGRHLLSVITVRDVTEYQQTKELLEQRVAERTAELSATFARLQDETEQRLRVAQELRDKEQILVHQSRMAAMGEMIGFIAHQWRQPLNALGLLMQELAFYHKRGLLTPEYMGERAARAQQLIEHMSQTIEDFRSFFKSDKQRVRFRVKDVLEHTLTLIQANFTEQQVAVQVFGEDDVVVEGYPNEYSQVILNILINGRDVLLEKEVEQPRIDIRIFKEDGRGVMTISDNGGGVPDEILDRIFDEYFTTKDPGKGTGLGLYISKTITEKNMGGLLSVRNVAGGAEFRIEVPGPKL